jgi:predicted membrane channel-forming protein YqfA (hemolysin III family)
MEKPLTLKLVVFLLFLDIIISLVYRLQSIVIYPQYPQLSLFWFVALVLLGFIAYAFLIVCLWLRVKLAYYVALFLLVWDYILYYRAGIFIYAHHIPEPIKTIILYIEIAAFPLLLASWSYFFKD